MPDYNDQQHRIAWSGMLSAVGVLLLLGCATSDHQAQRAFAADSGAASDLGKTPAAVPRGDRTARWPAGQTTGSIFSPPAAGSQPPVQARATDVAKRTAPYPAAGHVAARADRPAVARVAPLPDPAGAVAARRNPAAAVTATAPSVPAGSFAGTASVAIVAPRANEHISYALDLAQRGAVHSARAEFVMALELISGALDADTGTRVHTSAVQAGLTALREAEDFAPDRPHYETDLNLAHLAAVHHTVVLKHGDPSRMTPAEALQSYYTYATQQLARAGGKSPIASMALYGLARTEAVATAGAGNRSPLGGPKAIALYQAALLVDTRNHMAANELGVLLARYGHMQQAEGALLHSLSVAPQPKTWHNLAVVYRSLGRHEQARQAQQKHESLLAATRARGATSMSTGVGQPLLRWVDAETFAGTATAYGLEGPPTTTAPAADPQPEAQPERARKQPFARFVGWLRHSKSAKTDAADQTGRIADSPHGSRSEF